MHVVSLVVIQVERHAVTRWQVHDPAQEFNVISAIALRRSQRLKVVVDILRPSTKCTIQRGTFVDGCPDKPAFNVRLVIKLNVTAEKLEENCLRHVFGVGMIAQVVIGHAKHRVHVTFRLSRKPKPVLHPLTSPAVVDSMSFPKAPSTLKRSRGGKSFNTAEKTAYVCVLIWAHRVDGNRAVTSSQVDSLVVEWPLWPVELKRKRVAILRGTTKNGPPGRIPGGPPVDFQAYAETHAYTSSAMSRRSFSVFSQPRHGSVMDWP